MSLEKIYNNSPVFFQNLMTSVYGLQLHWNRYGGKNVEYTKQLEKTEFKNKEVITRFQLNELKKILKYAYYNTAYYKALFDEIKLDPSQIKSLDILNKIPLLTKNIIKEAPGLFLSKEFKKKKLSKIYTSGTTGNPLTVYYNSDSRRKNYAFFNRARKWHGTKVGDTRVTLYGRAIIPPTQEKPPFWRYDFFENNHLFSSYHLTPHNMPYYYEKIRQIQPKEIRGYPSSLNSLSQFMLDNDLSGIRPKAIFTTAETLLEPVRRTIETAFKCKVVDTYGCTEMGFYITQCEKGTYHAHPEFGIIESLDDNDKLIYDQPGHLVVTSFVNYAMPLIRYKIGDTVVIKNKECSCKRNFPVIEEIIGRTDDIIVTPDGRRIGRLDPIFKGGLGIKEAQIIQTLKNEIVMKIVKNDNYSEKDIAFLSQQLKNRLGEFINIKFEFVNEIKKDKSGKFRSVVSNIHR